MPTTTSRGYRLNYIVEGDGPALVLIPGLTQSLQRWVERGYVEHFARSFRVIALDPLGHGEEGLVVAEVFGCAFLEGVGHLGPPKRAVGGGGRADASPVP